MRRGLDGYLLPCALCGFQAPPGPVSQYFRWCIARGRHLFPFRTEPLSPSAPMVLGGQPPGRVGRRRFFEPPPRTDGGFFFAGCAEVCFWRRRGTLFARDKLGQPTKGDQMVGEIIGAVILGLLAGFIGRALLPGKQEMGLVMTIIVGLAGSLVGYFLFAGLLGIGDDDKFDLGGLVGAIIGTMLLLFV